MREMLTYQPHSASTDVSKAIGYLNNVTRHKSIVFILSDFADAGYEQTLKIASRRHDIIGIQVYDRRDKELPKIGLVQVRDAETGETMLMNTGAVYTQYHYNRQYKKIQEDAKQNFRMAGADLVQLATGMIM
jgi:hypothetical protein